MLGEWADYSSTRPSKMITSNQAMHLGVAMRCYCLCRWWTHYNIITRGPRSGSMRGKWSSHSIHLYPGEISRVGFSTTQRQVFNGWCIEIWSAW